MVFNATPGELFVIRNVATYGLDDQPHESSAAIEFAVRALRVPQIIVMGHAMRGGIQALLNGAPAEASDFVGQWVYIAEPARARAMTAPAERRQDICEHESVRVSLENLMTFPWIASAVRTGTLKLHGCFFDIRSGILERLGGDGIFRGIAD
jgi:carbonic anhydrase